MKLYVIKCMQLRLICRHCHASCKNRLGCVVSHRMIQIKGLCIDALSVIFIFLHECICSEFTLSNCDTENRMTCVTYDKFTHFHYLGFAAKFVPQLILKFSLDGSIMVIEQVHFIVVTKHETLLLASRSSKQL
jgi:hypothetical protein